MNKTKEFLEWLKDGKSDQFNIDENRTVVRIRSRFAPIDRLYMEEQSPCSLSQTTITKAALYHSTTGTLYDVSSLLEDLNLEAEKSEKLRMLMGKQVNSELSALSEIDGTPFSSEPNEDTRYLENSTNNYAIGKILGAKELRYSGYIAPEWTDETFHSYLTKPSDFVKQEKEKYIRSNERSLRNYISAKKTIDAKAQLLMNTPNHPVHIARSIYPILLDGKLKGWKTLNVTFKNRNSQTILKKIAEKSMEILCENLYLFVFRTLGLTREDEKDLEAFLGRSEILLQDIESIAYRNNIIWARS